MRDWKFKLSLRKVYIALACRLVSLSFFFLIRRLLLRLLFDARVDSNVTIHSNVYFFNIGRLSIGANTTINYGCYLDNRGGLFIGSNVNISHNVRIYTMGHNIHSSQFESISRSTIIEDDVWVFPNVLLMPGVKLARGAVILPGSVVTKDVAPMEIIGGNPAVKKGMRKAEASYKLGNSIWCAR